MDPQVPSEDQSPLVIDISPDKDGSVIKEIIREGNGFERPGLGDTVEVHYTGKLEDGTVFDSSVERGQKFTFTLGTGQVIKGWDVAVASMRRFELSKFTLAPHFAYGEQGSPPKIPPNAKLIFEIELFSWKMEDVTKKSDGGVLKTIKKEGSMYSTPNDGATAKIHLTLKYEDRVLEDRDVTFVIGEASESNLIYGVDLAVSKMKKGEVAQVFIKRDYAWRELPPRSFELPENYEQVVAEITLIDFEKRKESWEMDSDERAKSAEFYKNRGSEFFKQGKYTLALKQYKRTTQLVGPYNADDSEESKAILLAGYLNLAITYLKMNKPIEAKDNANFALEMDPNNIKALFRRGLAFLAVKEYDKAKADFETVIKIDPNNNAAKLELNNTLKALRDHRKKEQSIYGNMFKTFAERDLERERKLAGDVWKELSDEQKREFKGSKQQN